MTLGKSWNSSSDKITEVVISNLVQQIMIRHWVLLKKVINIAKNIKNSSILPRWRLCGMDHLTRAVWLPFLQGLYHEVLLTHKLTLSPFCYRTIYLYAYHLLTNGHLHLPIFHDSFSPFLTHYCTIWLTDCA